jgi:hypothetical protein
MGGEGASPCWACLRVQKDGCAQRTGAHARPKPTSYYYMCLANHGASEAVKIHDIGKWRNPQNVRNKREPVIFENKSVVI